MEGHPISAKRPRISVEESAVGQHQKEEMEEASPQKRWLCNELVWELCKEIPTAKTSDRILLTAHNMYAYLEPRFNKKLIYRDPIAFLKALLNAKKNIEIRIIVAQNDESEDDHKTIFELETNHFRIRIWELNPSYRSEIDIFCQSVNAHLLYFLRLIAPLLQPIQFNLDIYSSDIPIAEKVRFLNTQSDWIDSIGIDHHFNSEPIYEALSKYKKLQIYGKLSPVNVSKLVQWLTSNNDNSGQPKKYLSIRKCNLDDGPAPALLIGELKKEFIRATRKSRFVVRLELRQRLNKFTLCNELTGEKLQLLRLKKMKYGWIYIYVLSRSLDNGMDANESDCEELDTNGIHFLSL